MPLNTDTPHSHQCQWPMIDLLKAQWLLLWLQIPYINCVLCEEASSSAVLNLPSLQLFLSKPQSSLTLSCSLSPIPNHFLKLKRSSALTGNGSIIVVSTDLLLVPTQSSYFFSKLNAQFLSHSIPHLPTFGSFSLYKEAVIWACSEVSNNCPAIFSANISTLSFCHFWDFF